MKTGAVKVRNDLVGDWSYYISTRGSLIIINNISPTDIRNIVGLLDAEAALDAEVPKEDCDKDYYPGISLYGQCWGSIVVGKIPSGTAELNAYIAQSADQATLYIATERLRAIADRLENQPETIETMNINRRVKEIAEICGGVIVVFRWFL